MLRVMLLPSPPDSGSIGSAVKCLGLAKELREMGCRVSFVIGGKLKNFFEANGFCVYDYPVPVTSGRTEDITNALDFIRWTGMGDEEFAQKSVRAELAAIEHFCPDVIFAETRLSASIAARLMGIPTVMVAGWPLNSQFPGNKTDMYDITGNYNNILKYYGLEKVGAVTELFYEFADCKIAPTIQQLEPEFMEKQVEFLGLVSDVKKTEKPPAWYETWTEKPQVFIYLSVGAVNPELYIKTIIDIFENSPYRVICSCGFHYLLKNLPQELENIKFVRHISIPSIISDTAFIIFHGGQDMMLTSLANGIPSITIPGKHFERDYNASMLEKLGVSKKMMLQGFRKNRILDEMEKLSDQKHLRKCKNYQNLVNAYGGTKRCAEIVCALGRK